MTRSLVNNEDEVSLAILMLTFHANGLNDVFPLALLDYLRFLIRKATTAEKNHKTLWVVWKEEMPGGIQ